MVGEGHRDRLVIRKSAPRVSRRGLCGLTDPDSIRDWMCPGDIVEAKARLDRRVGDTAPHRHAEPGPGGRTHGRVRGRGSAVGAGLHVDFKEYRLPAGRL
jgi:hypothetical protein